MSSKGRVAICTPTLDRPTDAYLKALEESVPALEAAGWEHSAAFEVGNPYISAARASMLGKALKWGADAIVFIDDDVSWSPSDIVKLLEAEGDVVGGNYRYKTDDEARFMGKPFLGDRGHPLLRDSDDAVMMLALPAGFLKVTRHGVMRFLKAYPELRMNTEKPDEVNVDLFNHGVHNGTWFGEDFAFCRNWLGLGGDIFCVPDLDLVHNSRSRWDAHGFHPGKAYPSNYMQYLKTYRPTAEEKKAA